VAETLTAESAPAYLCDLSDDARAAVLLDPVGELAGASEDGERGGGLAELTGELLKALAEAADGGPATELEAVVAGGSVYLVHRDGWTLAVVARRSALPSLMLYDARVVLSRTEGIS
jgi:hypothetical protein